MSKKRISYIFPVYNNAPSLNVLHQEVTKQMRTIASKYDYEFVFVNDGSPDNSMEVLRKLAAKDKRVVVLNLSRNFGHQAAVTAGLNTVTGDAVVIMDADMQDPPAVALKLIKKWEAGFEIVYAQRRSRKDTVFKRFTANVYYRILSSLSSVDIPRNTGDFRLVDRKVVDVVNKMKEHNRFLRGLFSFTGFKQAGVLFDRHERFAGKSEYTLKKLIRLAKDGVFGFSDKPLHLVSRMGYFVSLLSLLGIIYALVIKIFFPEIAISGWTMIVVAIFFTAGVQLIMLGMIGEYIGRIYSEVRDRPNYIVAEEIRGGKHD